MNICIISLQTYVSGTVGGVSTHVAQLCSILKSTGHNVVIICPAHPEHPNEDYEEIIEEVLYFCVGNTSSSSTNRHWNQKSKNVFSKLSRSYDFRCIFSEGIAGQGIIKHHNFHNIPCFCFLHNFGITHFYNLWKEVIDINSTAYYFLVTIPYLITKIIKLEIPTYRDCSLLISCSSHNADRIHQFYRINQKNIFVLPNWVDTSEFIPSCDSRVLARKRWKCSETDLIFLLVGSLYRPKGFHIAIKSFSTFLKQHKDACLLIAGSGRQEKELKNFAKQFGLIEGHNIRFLGEVEHTLLPFLYNAADVFLMPSLLIEVLPYSLLEAMSCGLPFISTTNPGCREAAGNVGILIPPANENAMIQAMFRLAQNEEERTQIGRLARERVLNRFSQGHAENSIHSILKKIPA